MKRFLRSPREYAFRLRQETANLWLLARPPSAPGPLKSPLPFLPAASLVSDRLRGSVFALELISIADSILEHRFPILGISLDTGPEIHWRRDYSSAIETDTSYFRKIPYLDPTRAGDHKRIWELNRHQHLVVLAQAWLLTGRDTYVDEINRELESWFAQNPFQRGINWASALEVAFRSLSWMWLHHVVGNRLPKTLLDNLYQHGCHLEFNLSRYFSPNTHLLGEAVALHALGRMFAIDRWERTGADVVDQEMTRQIRRDGSHFEQSAYYHVYALDMFLFHAIVRESPPAWLPRLETMSEFLRALIGAGRKLAFFGDDDGGRFFHPYGTRDEFGCSTLATAAVFLNRPDLWSESADIDSQAAWWLNPANPMLHNEPEPSSRLFTDSGLAILTADDVHIIVDVGPFGPWGSGHSHSDTLSLVVRCGDEETLIDPGTYTYVGPERDSFRGSVAHNTIRIDGRDQANPVNPFRWAEQPSVRVREWTTTPKQDYLDAECSYAEFVHRRRVRFVKPNLLLIVDDIECPPGEHTIEQLWHPGAPVSGSGTRFRIGSRCSLVVQQDAEIENGWRSRALLSREPSPVIRLSTKTSSRISFAGGLVLNGIGELIISSEAFQFRSSDGTSLSYARS
jgi:hypothetical protein